MKTKVWNQKNVEEIVNGDEDDGRLDNRDEEADGEEFGDEEEGWT